MLFAHCQTPDELPYNLQYIQANYLLIPILHAPLAYTFILLCQSKLSISQIHYSSLAK